MLTELVKSLSLHTSEASSMTPVVGCTRPL